MKRLKNNKGAAFVEYVVAIGGLIAVFVVIGILLQYTAVQVAKRSVDSVKMDVPCKRGTGNIDDILSDQQCK